MKSRLLACGRSGRHLVFAGRYVCFVGALVAASLGTSRASAANPVEKPNLVLILADDLGYGDVGCYNAASKIPTPHIDRLAQQGTRFTDAHAAASVCVPTRYSLLTGRYAHRRPNRTGRFDGGPLIDEDVLTLPAMLRQAGYHTAMVGKWHLGFGFDDWDEPLRDGPVDRGFDSFFGVPASTDIPPYFFVEGDRAVAPPTDEIAEHHSDGVRPIQGTFWRAGGISPKLGLEDVLPTFADTALAKLDERAKSPDEPFFVYLALTAPHTPWLPSAAYHGRSKLAGPDVPEALRHYGDFVVQVDDIVGQVIAKLDEHGIADKTLVIFSSDNGPTWFPEDVERTGHDSAGPWRGMKGDVWEAGHRVPLVVRWPGRVPDGRTCDELVGQVDLMATTASLVGFDLPGEAAVDSLNLLPLLLGETGATGRATLITESSGGVLALRQGPWKFIPQLGSAGFSQPKREKPRPNEPDVQLYHLGDDPGETTNLAGDRPKLVADLSAVLERAKSTAPRSP
ncbi:MAG: arylsulfatase [Planctomycetaceae bacterium]